MKTNKKLNAAAAVREVLANIDSGVIFSGYDLKNLVVKKCPDAAKMYVDTLLREMRSSCRLDYVLESRSESLYKKITPSLRQRRAADLAKYQTLKQPELFSEGAL